MSVYQETLSRSPSEAYIRQVLEDARLGYIYNYPDKRTYKDLKNQREFVEEAWKGYEGPVGLYVHVPWCTPKPPTTEDAIALKQAEAGANPRDNLCSYCNLYTAIGKGTPNWFAQTVATEARMYAPILKGNVHPESLYFGGGSPSLLSVEDMTQIIQAIEDSVGKVDFIHERAIEVIPDSVDREKLEAMSALFNRISVGVQSFDPEVLRATGRAYDPDLARQTIRHAIDAGYKDVNGDLIFGLLGATEETCMSDLNQMIESGATTVTIYQNMIRPGTRAGRMVAAGLGQYLNAREIMQLTVEAHQRLIDAGYDRLSLTCWAKNTGYQQGEQIYRGFPILGIGPGARSYGPQGHYALPYTEDVRLINNANARWRTAIQNGEFPPIHGVTITEDIQNRSLAILGMMSSTGVPRTHMIEHFPEQINALLRMQLCVIDGDKVRYTDLGKAHSGALAELFFSDTDKQILQAKDSVRQH